MLLPKIKSLSVLAPVILLPVKTILASKLIVCLHGSDGGAAYGNSVKDWEPFMIRQNNAATASRAVQ